MDKDDKTLVLGVSANPTRYANLLVDKLLKHGLGVIPFGKSKGEVNDLKIENSWNPQWDVDTVSLYVRPNLQTSFYEPIITLSPRRVIFNPGTENPEFYKMLKGEGIQVEEACSLVLLSTGQY